MIITVRITTSNSKWTSFQYLSSNSKSRISTKSLLDQIEKGKIRAINPQAINGYHEVENVETK